MSVSMLSEAWVHLDLWGFGYWDSGTALTQGSDLTGRSASRQLSLASTWTLILTPGQVSSCPYPHDPAGPSWCCVWPWFPSLGLILDPHLWADIPAWPWSSSVPREMPIARSWVCPLPCFWLGWWDSPGWAAWGSPYSCSPPSSRELLAPAELCDALGKNCSCISNGQENVLVHMNHSWE